MSSARLDASLNASRRVMPGVRLLTLKLKRERKACVWPTARGSFSIQSGVSLPRRAAALRGGLPAESRTVSGFYRGGRRALHGSIGVAAEQVIGADRDKPAFHPLARRLDTILPRSAQFRR